MTSVQENKNELEAAVRYCESAISRAKATIESMEFRQQAATKAWHEQTGREESLTKKVEFLTKEYNSMKDYADRLLDENVEVGERNDELKSNMALMTDELEELKDAAFADANTIKHLKEQNSKLRETNNLQRDQIAMFQRKMSRMNEIER